jgi:hypothetical protein
MPAKAIISVQENLRAWNQLRLNALRHNSCYVNLENTKLGAIKKFDKEERPFKSRCGWVAWEVRLQLAMRTTLWISHVTRPQIQNKIFIAPIN